LRKALKKFLWWQQKPGSEQIGKEVTPICSELKASDGWKIRLK
jgi:hypothetical protein